MKGKQLLNQKTLTKDNYKKTEHHNLSLSFLQPKQKLKIH